MDIDTEMIKTKGNIKLNDMKIKALIEVLVDEGIITREDFEQKLTELVEEKDED